MDAGRRLQEIESRMLELPKGSVGYKTVNGRRYAYRRWSERGKRFEKYVPAEDVEALKAAIAERKGLEAERRGLLESGVSALDRPTFECEVLQDFALEEYVHGVEGFERRDAFGRLMAYLEGPETPRVFILYGLRRTGKTVLVRQALAALGRDRLSKAAFIQVRRGDTMAALNRDLRRLADAGCRYVFIDEVTLLDDFVEGSALLADVFATRGMRIVLSGTDSLGFMFAEDSQLYDRCLFEHTTFIPYREYERVVGVSGIDEYICRGGTLASADFGSADTFSSPDACCRYVETSIASNIQRALVQYQDGGHFGHLYDLYERGELTSAINRVVEDMNHRLTREVFNRDFRSNDLAISARNLRSDNDVLDHIDVSAATARLKDALEILDRNERTLDIDETCRAEIGEYLELLDVTAKVDVFRMPNVRKSVKRTVIVQPGLRYAQAMSLVESLLEDETFASLSFGDALAVLRRIGSEVRGRMLEDIVLYETSVARPDRRVFKLQFSRGEFDMVVLDASTLEADVYEVKHSDKVEPLQARHLADPELLGQFEAKFGPVRSRTVLYRGPDTEKGGISWRNVESYLRGLGR
jgi:hypothetical protein